VEEVETTVEEVETTAEVTGHQLEAMVTKDLQEVRQSTFMFIRHLLNRIRSRFQHLRTEGDIAKLGAMEDRAGVIMLLLRWRNLIISQLQLPNPINSRSQQCLLSEDMLLLWRNLTSQPQWPLMAPLLSLLEVIRTLNLS
jgi:hypothetical protein